MKYMLGHLKRVDMLSVLQTKYPDVFEFVDPTSVVFEFYRHDYKLLFRDKTGNAYKLEVFACMGEVPAILECADLSIRRVEHVDLFWLLDRKLLQGVS